MSKHVHLTPSETVKIRNWADLLGLGLSVLCLIHCLLTPILLILLPSLSFLTSESEHEWLHRILLAVLPLLALAAFVPGYFRHRDKRVFYWGLPGIVLLAIGVVVFEGQIGAQASVTIAGSLFLIRSHLLNRELCACCETGHDHTHDSRQTTHVDVALPESRVTQAEREISL